MTWYWWTHWFWITALIGTLTGLPAGAGVDQSATKTFSTTDRQSALRRIPIMFHDTDAEPDEDDVFNGRALDERELIEPHIPQIRPTNTKTTVARLVIAQSQQQQQMDQSNQQPTTTPNYTEEHIITARLNTKLNEIASSNTLEYTTNTSDIQSISKSSNQSFANKSASADILRNFTNISAEAFAAHTTDDRPNHTSNDPALSKPSNKPVRQSKNLATQRLLTDGGKSVDNYTAETKNLLTAISAAAVSVSDDDVVSERELSADARTSSSLDAGAISGICLAALGLCVGVAAAGVLAYRRRYVNKPQTLGEPDSSGYIDDSTIRDNSDEMYSLDNDSFLNSLEAMTIQNYWTENVKHTKL